MRLEGGVESRDGGAYEEGIKGMKPIVSKTNDYCEGPSVGSEMMRRDASRRWGLCRDSGVFLMKLFN